METRPSEAKPRGVGGIRLPVMTVSPALRGWLRAESSLASQTSGSKGWPHDVAAVAFADLLVVDFHDAVAAHQVEALPVGNRVAEDDAGVEDVDGDAEQGAFFGGEVVGSADVHNLKGGGDFGNGVGDGVAGVGRAGGRQVFAQGNADFQLDAEVDVLGEVEDDRGAQDGFLEDSAQHRMVEAGAFLHNGVV